MPDLIRVYRPYWEWEDYADGLYERPGGQLEVDAAGALLADPTAVLAAMRAAVRRWPAAAEHQLSNREQNRRAWLGWAACRVAAGATALATRHAWAGLSDAERYAANGCADRVIAEWEAGHRPVLRQLDLLDLLKEAGDV